MAAATSTGFVKSNYETVRQPLVTGQSSCVNEKNREVVEKALNNTDKNIPSRSLSALYELQLIQLPSELLILTFLQLSIKELLQMRLICSEFKTLIDTNPELQAYIAFQFLQETKLRWNISMEDLKVDYTNKKLSIEVNNNLSLAKLTQTNSALPLLTRILPWISHLIIKKGQSNELLELFTQLKKTQRLTTVYLLNCEIDGKAMQALLELSTRNPPYFYFCNVKTVDCELPLANSHLTVIDSNKAADYSIEKFVTKESDRIALNELSSQVENESSSSDLIVQQFESLNATIKADIIASIWYSYLMTGTNTCVPISKKSVSSFVSSSPHHPAVCAALKQVTLVYSS